MKIKLNSTLIYFRKKLLLSFLNALLLLCLTSAFGSTTDKIETNFEKSTQQLQVTGLVLDSNGQPLPGATILEKGTTNGVQTDFDGKFSITVSNQKATLIASYVGYVSIAVMVNNKTYISITLQEDVSALEEVVVVGYGTQKKVNLTAAVSQVGKEIFENRATANAVQSLQGTVPGLVISNSDLGGEPGASSNINIRGFITSTNNTTGTFDDAGPLVLIDGIEMDLNDIDPENIESVSVLKDAAAASIYGSRAAGGAILVITKSGKNMNGDMKVTYSNSFSISQPTIWPKNASAIDFAYTVNDARINNRQGIWHDETDLANIRANMENPGSAPTIVANAAGTNWDYGTWGILGTAATNWDDIVFKDWAARTKHNLSLSGGNKATNYYISAGAYDEGGFLATGNESFQRYNLDAKISTKANDWLTLELLTKYRKSYTDFPYAGTTNQSVTWNKTRVFDLISKLKPTMPQYDPIYGSDKLTFLDRFDTQRIESDNSQLVLMPKFIIEPLEGLKITAQFNYKTDNNIQKVIVKSSLQIMPQGLVDAVSQANTSYKPTAITQEYFSPNFYADYEKSIGDHNFNATVGYQSELNNYYSLGGNTDYLVTNNIVSINASLDDDQLVSESITNWAVQSLFSRFRYNFKEKYLFEFSYRRDGSSRFKPEDRWAGFPSYSAGWNVAKEDFWSIEAINTFKLRGSYGTLGNQNVGLYDYLSTIDLNTTGTSYLFDGNRETFALTPGLNSRNLSWERVKTTDIGFDLGALNNKLNVGFSWYRTDIEDMAGQGLDLPAQLGTSASVTNVGTSRIQGWEIEATWRQQLGDFGYNIRGVLSDYKRTIVKYPNDANSLAQPYFEGQNLGDIWGYQTDGLFQTNEEATEYTAAVDQSFINGFTYEAGDLKYVDLNGNGEIDRGSYTVGDTGDYQVIGNSTPRYQYSINLGLNYKDFDFNALIQGVGKRDVNLANSQGFRGPSNGPFHFFVWEGQLDYFRGADTTNPLGPNLDAYFPKPYMNGGGRTNKNYRQNSTHFIQNGAYARLKSVQIGYTLPKKITSKIKVNNFRLFVTGENLFTVTDLMFYDPESVNRGLTGSAQSYPLAKVISMGLNVSF